MRIRSDLDVPVPPWGLAVMAILSVQLGSALSVDLIEAVGPAGRAWLRLSMGVLILLAIARPPLRSVRRSDMLPLLGLGITTGLVTIGFLAAIEHIPLGTAVAIEFLGPLTVAAVRSHNKMALIWPAVALLGVVLLTQPWQGDVNLTGVTIAALAAVGWAAYILVTQRIGDRFTGIGALSMTVPIAGSHSSRPRHPANCSPPHLRDPGRRGRARHPAARAAVRAGNVRPAQNDTHSVRHPHGPRTGRRSPPRTAHPPPAALGHAGPGHPARRSRRRRGAARGTTAPKAEHPS
ncbi:hypothetical protein ABIA70_002218 [Arthrobacter sp. 754]